jgi:hypothetical protein
MRYGPPVKLSFGMPVALCVASLIFTPILAAENPAATPPAAAATDDAALEAEAAELLAKAATSTPAAPESGNPYRRLVLRNAFAIKPPPPPAPEVPVVVSNPPVALPIFVTGFSLLKGVKKVYLVVNRPGAKGPDYVTASEGEEFEGFQIVAIDPKKETVRVMNGGNEATLNFKDNGMKPTVGTAPGGNIPTPGARPGMNPSPGGGGGGGATIIGQRGAGAGVITGGGAAQPVDSGFAEVRGRGSVITGGVDPTVPTPIAPAGGYTPAPGANPVVPVPRTRPAPVPPPLPQ